MKQWYAVILAGGKGERLWPLSRQKKPKQLLPFGKDSTLLEQTIARVSPLIPCQQRWVVSTQDQQQDIQNILGAQVGTILSEPAGRNTGPAILYTCLKLYETDQEAVALFLSADHFIPDQALFLKNLEIATHHAQKNNTITLLGIKPTFAATGYGYIEHETQSDSDVYCINRFHEKPSTQQAEDYFLATNMLWNSGMFCGKASTFIKEYQLHAPELFEQVTAFIQQKKEYNDITSISIDHAVMEKSNNTCVLPATFSWSDVGNLDVFLSLLEQTQENNDAVFTVDAQHNLIYNETKPIALIGVDNLCIVETKDALLVANRNDVEKVKQILQQLRAVNKTDIL